MASYSGSQGNKYEEVTVTSESGPCGKLCGSLCCSILGVLVYFSSLALVAYNEKSTVCVQRSLDFASRQYEEASCDGSWSSSSDNPTYLSCPLSEASLPAWSPSDFGAHWLKDAFKTTAAKISQKVETLQCVEEKHSRSEKQGDKKVNIDSWTYKMSWKEQRIDSAKFKAWSINAARDALHAGCGRSFSANPISPLQSKDLSTQSLVAGSFDLSRHLSKVATDEPLLLQQGSYSLPTGMGGSTDRSPERRLAKDGNSYTKAEFYDYYGEGRGEAEWQAGAPDSAYASPVANIQGSTVNTCKAGSEDIGCMRVSYHKSSATHASYMGKITGSGPPRQTRPWIPPATWLCGTGSSEVDLFHASAVSANHLIDMAASSNNVSTWVLRILGIVLAVVGVMLFLNPLQAVADLVDEFFDWFRFIPVAGWMLDKLGDAVAGAVGCAIFTVSFFLGTSSALLILSITWCVMRPLLGIPILLISIAGFLYSVKYLVQMVKQGQGKRKGKNKVG
mmetsp:Transcript_16690/g.29203  ORF Transcript_16690/g.29203 Transcript_16690/m.29203 type:complete len:505 (+) Transcript_16690:46-1560(+)